MPQVHGRQSTEDYMCDEKEDLGVLTREAGQDVRLYGLTLCANCTGR